MTIENNHRVVSGLPIKQAKKVLILLHGRGDSASNFIGLSGALDLTDFTAIALQANQNTWYPYSFLAPLASNQPYLDESLGRIKAVTGELSQQGFTSDQIYFLGFSQGACLTLEYTTRHAKKYGGIIAFTGGLIGEHLSYSAYRGDFEDTPVFMGSSDHDPHVPEQRIDESVSIIEQMGTTVDKVIYPGMGHTINQDEIDKAKAILNRR